MIRPLTAPTADRAHVPLQPDLKYQSCHGDSTPVANLATGVAHWAHSLRKTGVLSGRHWARYCFGEKWSPVLPVNASPASPLYSASASKGESLSPVYRAIFIVIPDIDPPSHPYPAGRGSGRVRRTAKAALLHAIQTQESCVLPPPAYSARKAPAH